LDRECIRNVSGRYLTRYITPFVKAARDNPIHLFIGNSIAGAGHATIQPMVMTVMLGPHSMIQLIVFQVADDPDE
jgi:hypothetical protein